MPNPKLTYQQAGVDYAKIDPLKVMAQKAARDTAHHLRAAGYPEIEASRGESAYVIDVGEFYMATITECLGTKALVADRMRSITGRTYYDRIAQDTIATAINDLITVGAKPLTLHAYWATGGSDWFEDEQRMRDLVAGWKRTCDETGVAWGGGETPSLSGVVAAGAIDLAASCMGIINPKSRLTLGDKLVAGDAIILLASSGIHANGVSLARKLADRLPEGYATPLPDGRLYGEALLDATMIYSELTEMLFAAGIDIHYLANITGHGWRKIMRHPASLTYRITALPPVPQVLQFIVEQTQSEPYEAYGNLNMGAGFALFVNRESVDQVLTICATAGMDAYHAGMVETGPQQVIVEPLEIVFEGESLGLRG